MSTDTMPRISKKQLTPEVADQIQRDIRRLREPFVQLVDDIYIRNNFTLMLVNKGSVCQIIYPQATIDLVESIYAECQSMVDQHIQRYREEYEIPEILP